MSILGAIASLGTGIYQVTRRGSGSYDLDGRFTPDPAPITFQIAASVQPVSGRDLQVLPEGLHAEETRVIYTTTELRTQDAAGVADEVTIDGLPYTVRVVERWDLGGRAYYKAIAAKRSTP